MKKTIKFILTLSLSMTCVVAFSQEEATANAQLKAVPDGYLPVAGDLSLGVSVNPFLNYAGNLLNGTQNNSFSNFGGEPYQVGPFSPNVSIMGKYMLKDNMAVRANIGILGSTEKEAQYVQDDKAVVLDPLSQDKVVDEKKHITSGMSIALGLEFKRTYRKIQGFAGASLFFSSSKESYKYTYGNEITDINQLPTTYNFGGGSWNPQAYLPSARVLETSSAGNINAVGLIGFVGVEWFFAPKVSIGGEVNLSVRKLFYPQTTSVYEGYNPVTSQKETYTQTQSPAYSEFDYGTQSAGANVFLNFYF